MSIELVPVDHTSVIKEYKTQLKEMHIGCHGQDYEAVSEEKLDQLKHRHIFYPRHLLIRSKERNALVGYLEIDIINNDDRHVYKKCMIHTFYLHSPYVKQYLSDSDRGTIIQQVYDALELFCNQRGIDIIFINIDTTYKLEDMVFKTVLQSCGMVTMAKQYLLPLWERRVLNTYKVPEGWFCIRTTDDLSKEQKKYFSYYTRSCFNENVFCWFDDCDTTMFTNEETGGILYKHTGPYTYSAICSVYIDSKEDMTHLIYPKANEIQTFKELLDVVEHSDFFPATSRASIWMSVVNPYNRYLVRHKCAVLSATQLVAKATAC